MRGRDSSVAEEMHVLDQVERSNPFPEQWKKPNIGMQVDVWISRRYQSIIDITSG